jgi:DNA-binding XRE family transcriptional regulator
VRHVALTQSSGWSNRLRCGLSYDELAAVVDVSRRISAYNETRSPPPPGVLLVDLARVLRASTDESSASSPLNAEPQDCTPLGTPQPHRNPPGSTSAPSSSSPLSIGSITTFFIRRKSASTSSIDVAFQLFDLGERMQN